MALLVLERVQLRALVGGVQSSVGILQVPVVLAVVPLPLETLAVETLSGKLPGKIRVRKNLSWKVRSTLERKTLSGKLLPEILARKWLARILLPEVLSWKLLTHVLSLPLPGSSILGLVVAVSALK